MMSIALRCESCQHSFHVNDKWAGRRIKCPECVAKVEVPAAGDALSAFMSWADRQAARAAGEDDVKWYLQTFSGRQYGPVERRLLDYWQRLGAISARSQVLRQGDTQWRWASDLYPQLSGPAANAAAESGSGVRW